MRWLAGRDFQSPVIGWRAKGGVDELLHINKAFTTDIIPFNGNKEYIKVLSLPGSERNQTPRNHKKLELHEAHVPRANTNAHVAE